MEKNSTPRTEAQLRFEYRSWRAAVLERLRFEVERKTSQRGLVVVSPVQKIAAAGLVNESWYLFCCAEAIQGWPVYARVPSLRKLSVAPLRDQISSPLSFAIFSIARKNDCVFLAFLNVLAAAFTKF